MKLTEIIKLMDEESKNGLVNVDDWRIQDAEHLLEMGFKMIDDYRFATDRDPKIKVYKKKETMSEKNMDDEKADSDSNIYFYVEEEKKKTRRFKEFEDIIEYFAKYAQPELDKNR